MKTHKHCSACLEYKTIDQFELYHKSYDGYRATCNSCIYNSTEIDPNRMEKVCSHCDTVKSVSEFNKNRNSPDGHGYRCKSCRKGVSKQYYESQIEIYGSLKDYRKDTYAYGIHYHRAARANARANDKITPQQVAKLYNDVDGKCFFCNIQTDDSYHLDHMIPLSKGGKNVIENCVISCAYCNQAKHDMLLSEFCNWLELISKRISYLRSMI